VHQGQLHEEWRGSLQHRVSADGSISPNYEECLTLLGTVVLEECLLVLIPISFSRVLSKKRINSHEETSVLYY